MYSTTHSQWCKCSIVERRRKDGAVRVNIKKGKWLNAEEQGQRLRVCEHGGETRKTGLGMAVAVTSSSTCWRGTHGKFFEYASYGYFGMLR